MGTPTLLRFTECSGFECIWTPTPRGGRIRLRRTANLMTTPNTKDLALVMTGGGARAAYQVGFLRTICRLVPDFEPPINEQHAVAQWAVLYHV